MTPPTLPRLERWSVITTGRGYEVFGSPYARLDGTVFGHPSKRDGEEIITSTVASADGRQVTTSSGTVYLLGEPHWLFLEWLAEERFVFNAERPFESERTKPWWRVW